MIDLLERPTKPARRGRPKRITEHVGGAAVQMEWGFSPASVWNVGDGIWGYEEREEPVYTGVVLIDREGDWRLMACIEAPTWPSMATAVNALGFTRPKLTAEQVREGWRPAERKETPGGGA